MPTNGFLLVDKPKGPTSHDVVAAVRHTATSLAGRRVKVGHAGTLDPLASGLLILGLGQATKSLGMLVGLPKCYDCMIELGSTTVTDDAEAPLTPTLNAQQPTSEQLTMILGQFIGKQEQRPPNFSAKKQMGTPLYKLARAGKVVTPRLHSVTIFDLTVQRFDYPLLTMSIRCSSGTYIRSLARDIGAALKTGGFVRELRRTAIGLFSLIESVDFEEIDQTTLTTKLIAPEPFLARSADVQVTEE
ncbi:tRNA pseudouridine(55) synthase TruB [Candidatus Uhrbacteria bacterium CG10_big_fil_rev_8_21_14_0_10_48_11]|uniref:tRNA pseudouridine synthase B n=1 Tax=Candidatus Uhrbacteria bacterium CG10_big_fil_rev_8_21_14_0_10_48_11 TaxID=1975037 RepID=A0A2M8LFT8_9BACT|nr:MAG: tRNA pseudouridine(55) synthase TruB [Candidatus Uhrbacteria bacterium CG10_big_fil_rev_8_21_14_0_10_48_11]